MQNRASQGDKNIDWIDVKSHSLSSEGETLTVSIPVNNENKNTDGKGIVRPRSIIIRGKENLGLIADALLQNCKSSLELYCSKSGLSVIIDLSQYSKIYAELKNKNVKIRVITEITVDNLEYCKQIIDLLNVNLKHLEGTDGVFAIADNSLYITKSPLEDSTFTSELIYSNIKGIINQNKFLFETMWKKAIPSEQRIKEIEQRKLPIETYLIDDPQDGLNYSIDFVNRVEERLSICTSIGHLKLLDTTKPLLQVYLELLSKQKKGIVKDGIRWLTYIDNNKKDMELVKKFLGLDIEIRHSDHLPPLNFAISDKQFVGSIEKIVGPKMFERIFHSTEPLYMSHFQSNFDELWREGIDANERLRHINIGISSEPTKVIENPVQSKNIFLKMLEEAKEEVVIIFPTINSVKRQSKIGLFNLLKNKNQENFRIRILSPDAEIVKEILLLEYSKEKGNMINNVAIREIARQQEIGSTILMVDKKQLLTFEVKDNTRETFEGATGLATYSTSLPTLLWYISIFESLWIQTEMFDNLRIANDKLIRSDELEREFINTAAHELRTPTQAIMGYMELDEEIINVLLKITKLTADEELNRIINHLQRHFNAVSRNAFRLNELINIRLDVARIESNRRDCLLLHKERLDLVKEIKEST